MNWIRLTSLLAIPLLVGGEITPWTMACEPAPEEADRQAACCCCQEPAGEACAMAGAPVSAGCLCQVPGPAPGRGTPSGTTANQDSARDLPATEGWAAGGAAGRLRPAAPRDPTSRALYLLHVSLRR